MDAIRKKLENKKQQHLIQARSVLNALTDVITAEKKKNNNIKQDASESITCYFAALMSTISDPRSIQQSNSMGGMLYLLAEIFPLVPTGVLQAKLKIIVTLFIEVLKTKSANMCMLISVISATSILLQKVDAKAWGIRDVVKLANVLLIFSVDSRSKIRREARKGFVNLIHALCSTHSPASTHSNATNDKSFTFPKAFAKCIADFSVREISEFTTKNARPTLYLCKILQESLEFLPIKSTAIILQALLKLLPTSSDAILRVLVFNAIQSALKPQFNIGSKPIFITELSSARVNLIKGVLEELYNLKPHRDDDKPTIMYLQCVATGLTTLFHLDPLGTISLLGQYFPLLVEGLLSNKPDSVAATSACCAGLLARCITKQVIDQTISICESKENKSPIVKIFSTLERLLSVYEYRSAWQHVLHMIAEFLPDLPQIVFPFLVPLLKIMDKLHDQCVKETESEEYEDINHMKVLENSFGSAISCVGPENILSALPLETDESTSGMSVLPGRWWLLLLIKKYTMKSRLAYFHGSLIPLIDKLKKKLDATPQSKLLQIKMISSAITQLWDTFTGFCGSCDDVRTAFKPMAKLLGQKLNFNSQGAQNFADMDWTIRLIICEGLGVLSRSVQKRKKEAMTEENKSNSNIIEKMKIIKKDIKALSKFSKNFLPIFFNLAKDLSDEKRKIVLESISAWIGISDNELIIKLFQIAFQKLSDSTSSLVNIDKNSIEFQQIVALYEILSAMLKGEGDIPESLLSDMFQAVNPLLICKNASIQKATYQMLAIVCEYNDGFLLSNWNEMADYVSGAMSECKVTCSKHRITCLKHITMAIPKLLARPDVLKRLPLLLGEVILALKDDNKKTQQIAFTILESLAKKFLTIKGDNLPDSAISSTSCPTNQPLMAEYILMILGGLAGTPRMKSASIMALANLIYKFHSNIEDTMLSNTFQTILVIVNDKNVEVRKSVINFIKVSVVVLTPEMLKPHLTDLVTGIIRWCDKKCHVKPKIKAVLEILIRRFDPKIIMQLVPQRHTPLIEHIYKQEERKKREMAKISNKNSDATNIKDVNDNDKNTKQHNQKGNNEGRKVWISNEDINFLDSSTAHHIRTSNPKKEVQMEENLQDNLHENQSGQIIISADEASKAGFKLTAKAKKDKIDKIIRFDESDSDSDIQVPNLRTKGGLANLDFSGFKSRAIKKSKKKGSKKNKVYESGERFRSSRGRGDTMKRDGVEPFAFMSLNPAGLKKNKRRRTDGRLANMLNAAQLGARAAKKSKKKGFKKRKK